MRRAPLETCTCLGCLIKVELYPIWPANNLNSSSGGGGGWRISLMCVCVHVRTFCKSASSFVSLARQAQNSIQNPLLAVVWPLLYFSKSSPKTFLKVADYVMASLSVCYRTKSALFDAKITSTHRWRDAFYYSQVLAYGHDSFLKKIASIVVHFTSFSLPKMAAGDGTIMPLSSYTFLFTLCSQKQVQTFTFRPEFWLPGPPHNFTWKL